MLCLVTQLNTERKTSSSHFCRQKVVWLKWVLSVLRHCKETCWVWNWQWGSASLNCTPACESKNVSFSNPLRKTIWVFEKNILGADSLFTTVNFSGQCMPFLKKHCTWISLLGALSIEHLGSQYVVGLTPLTKQRPTSSHQLLRGNIWSVPSE